MSNPVIGPNVQMVSGQPPGVGSSILGGLANLASQVGLGFLGTRLAASRDKRAAEQQFRYQAGLGKMAYRRSRRFRRTAYQDTVQDLRRAGLNPILAVSQGATGGTAMASGQAVAQGAGSAQVQAGSQYADRLASSARAAMATRYELRMLQRSANEMWERQQRTKKEAAFTQEQTTSEQKRQKILDNQKRESAARADIAETENRLLDMKVPAAKYMYEVDLSAPAEAAHKARHMRDISPVSAKDLENLNPAMRTRKEILRRTIRRERAK